MANNIGKITQIIGAVLDIKFTEGNLPEINDAIKVPTRDGKELVVEVSQHLGDDIVRCIAMGSTDGLVRGMDAIATGAPISVPVGENTLGRMFNVLGNPIDEIDPPTGVETWHNAVLMPGQNPSATVGAGERNAHAVTVKKCSVGADDPQGKGCGGHLRPPFLSGACQPSPLRRPAYPR